MLRTIKYLVSGLHVILISLGAVGLVLILIEIVPDVWIDHRLSLKEPGTIQDTGDFRLAAKEYGNLEWPYYLYADTWRSRRYLEWRPFVYWRRAGYESPYVYVNERGLRRTWLAKQDNRQPYNIFMFGGSTMWGFGARDSHTIAPELAKLLANKSIRNVRVTNFGEAGYVLTQVVFTFLMELQRGNRPDMIIFLDGCNDVVATEINQVAGFAQNEINRRREFNILNKHYRHKQRAEFPGQLFHRTLRQLTRFIQSLGLAAPQKEFPAADVLTPAINDLADIYANTVEFVSQIGGQQNIKVLFFLQPTAYSKENLGKHEQRWSNRIPAAPNLCWGRTKRFAGISA